jgi:probable HAF family extracellular repeat protein
VFTVVKTGLSNAYDINSAGLVVGDAVPVGGGTQQAATWTFADGLTIVGPLPGGGQSRFDGVNEHNEAVGVTNFSGFTQAYYWSQATDTKVNLAGPGSGPFAHEINDDGDVAGTRFGGYASAFFKPAGGTAVELPIVGPYVAAHGSDMNNSDVIVGVGLVTDFVDGAIMWPRFDLAPVTLAALGGNRSKAQAINNAGDIVGWSELTPGSTTRHALLWPATGGMVDLTTWPNGCVGTSEAFGISEEGIIVGHCNGLAVLWTAMQGMRFLPAPTWGSGFATPRAINSGLEIAGGEAYWRVANQPPTANAGGPYSGNEGSPVAFDGSGSLDPDGDALTYAWTFGDGGTGTGVSPTHSYADNGVYPVTLVVTDTKGAASSAVATTATIANVAPTITSLSVPADPVAVGSTVALAGSFTDPSSVDTHSAAVDWDDGAGAQTAAVDQTGRTLSASRAFTAAGVYTVTVTVTDDDGGSAVAVATEYVVVYDPSAGFVTGGGWITSPAGSCVSPTICGAADPGGKATFGFVSKYKKGATTPTGNTEFQYHLAGLNFSSTSYQWLVVAGARAQYKGQGTINGAGLYGFLITAIDGQQPGGGEVDQFRIKIWDQASGDVVYDNQLGAPEDSSAATAVGGGSIAIHP